jgi:hypothetical protein
MEHRASLPGTSIIPLEEEVLAVSTIARIPPARSRRISAIEYLGARDRE